MATFAQVLTFHLPSEQIPSLLEILDTQLTPPYAQHRSFRGLTCLELREGPHRSHISVVSLWDDSETHGAEQLADRSWDDASELLGVGIARQTCRVLRRVPGNDQVGLTEIVGPEHAP
jgi:hypothetical protein